MLLFKRVGIVFLFISLFLLVSCWSKENINTYNKNKKMSLEQNSSYDESKNYKKNEIKNDEFSKNNNIIKQTNTSSMPIQRNNTNKKGTNWIEKNNFLDKQDWGWKIVNEDKIKNLLDTKWLSYFNNIDCSKYSEKNDCYDLKLLSKLSLCWNTITSVKELEVNFNLKEYPDSYKEKVLDYKKKCILELKKLAPVIDHEKIIKKIDNLNKTFKLDDCKKVYIKLNKNKLIDKKDEAKFVEYCKIGYAIKIKGDCNIIDDIKLKTKCIDIKKKLDKYIELQKLYKTYYKDYNLWNFVYPNLNSTLDLEK